MYGKKPLLPICTIATLPDSCTRSMGRHGTGRHPSGTQGEEWRFGVSFISKYGLVKYYDSGGPKGFRKRYSPDTDQTCEICGNRGPLVADHCHKHRWTRGFVCRNCNVSLGMNWFYYLKESQTELIRRIISHYGTCPNCLPVIYNPQTGRFTFARRKNIIR